jgi:hypothetical protein
LKARTQKIAAAILFSHALMHDLFKKPAQGEHHSD